jgi:hypothetical protein
MRKPARAAAVLGCAAHAKKSNHRLRLQAAVLDPRPQHAAINYTIEQVDARKAAAFVRRYEYLGDAGYPLSCYGARNAAGELAAVAIFGRPAVTLDQNTIVLERGACATSPYGLMGLCLS